MPHAPHIPSSRHLDSHFSYAAKGLSMSCNRQRPESELPKIFHNALPTFFAPLSTFAKLGPKIPFQKKVHRPNLCRLPLPFLHGHMSLTPRLRYLDSNFSYRAKGPSMSCDRQRPSRSPHDIFQNAFPTFFVLSTSLKYQSQEPLFQLAFVVPFSSESWSCDVSNQDSIGFRTSDFYSQDRAPSRNREICDTTCANIRTIYKIIIFLANILKMTPERKDDAPLWRHYTAIPVIPKNILPDVRRSKPQGLYCGKGSSGKNVVTRWVALLLITSGFMPFQFLPVSKFSNSKRCLIFDHGKRL